MKVEVIDGREIDASLAAAWTTLLDATALPETPYLHPEWTRRVAAVRSDVRVAIMGPAEAPEAILPFQLGPRRTARPVGGPINDAHGLITADTAVDPARVVAAAGLATFDFDHLHVGGSPYGEAIHTCDPSPTMNLADGYEAYERARRAAGSSLFKKLGNLRRRLARDHEAPRLTVFSTDLDDLRTLQGWKSEQCARSGSVDVFGPAWIRSLTERLVTESDAEQPAFSGIFSTLHVGDQLMAAHLGMRTRTILHYWFPSYDHAWHPFSAGLMLLTDLAAWAAEEGITTIDLGKGEADYKQRVADGAFEVATGAIEHPSVERTVRRVGRSLDRAAAATPLSGFGAKVRGRVERRTRRRRYD
ncbi:MAG: GNAT family N-acetyltransferase [Phycisphaerales bacterium]